MLEEWPVSSYETQSKREARSSRPLIYFRSYQSSRSTCATRRQLSIATNAVAAQHIWRALTGSRRSQVPIGSRAGLLRLPPRAEGQRLAGRMTNEGKLRGEAFREIDSTMGLCGTVKGYWERDVARSRKKRNPRTREQRPAWGQLLTYVQATGNDERTMSVASGNIYAQQLTFRASIVRTWLDSGSCCTFLSCTLNAHQLFRSVSSLFSQRKSNRRWCAKRIVIPALFISEYLRCHAICFVIESG